MAILTPKTWIAKHRNNPIVRYGGAALTVWVALSVWTFSPLLHRHPTALYLAAVLLTARYLGLGPSIFCSALSVFCLDFFVMSPPFSFAIAHTADFERLIVFLAVSLFAASMAKSATLAESHADRAQREMAAIVESSSDAILTTTPDGMITSWNRAAERLFGFTAEEAFGISVTRLAPPERAEEVERNLQTLNAGGRVDAYQTERIRKDGSRWPVSLTISPLLNRRGQMVGTSAIVRDLSAEKQSEEALRQREKLATAGRMAASIAHEINNPLEAVINLLYLASHDSTRSKEYLRLAEREIHRVAQLAQQTLGFVRESEATVPLDPAAIMDETLQLYSRQLSSRGVQVVRRYREIPTMSGYAGELRQLFANLIVNATDAMGEDGWLHIRIAPGHDRVNDQEGIRITVADTGMGIPRDDLAHIFKPFYTTKKDTGTGLGLWVSSEIVQKHGGSIRVRSRASRGRTGTVFSIFLPCRCEVSQVA